MPSLGADMETAKVVEWLVKPGDMVAHGQVVAVVETQKGAIEIECFEAGEVVRLDAKVGETLPVGAPLALIRAAGEAAPSKAKPRPAKARPSKAPPDSAQGQPPDAPPEIPTPPPEVPEVPREVPEQAPDEAPGTAPAEVPEPPPEVPGPTPPEVMRAVAPPPQGAGPPASPAARQRAAEAGVSLAAVVGTGPGGATLLGDVERHIGAAQAEPPAPPARPGKQGLDMAEMRKAIAAAMVRSKREIPHYYLSHQIDLQPATDWLAATNARRQPETRLLMGALLLRAAVLAATKSADLNGQFTDGAYRPSQAVHAGLVVALRGGGLIAPAIRDAETLALDALMEAMRDIVARARNGRLRNSELTEGTITISSMGETGAEALFGVIYPPQVALVGFGAPQRRPWVVGDTVEPRMILSATLSADHRISDGRRGARLLTEIERLLKEPESL
ncbi:MAG: 2-oxo acid dehydrogenase subunit E2 [Rhodobacteraceae bacterium]|nr:2-oxo acid dehydrogenase subunit E2 [Paracoccaceae bacterium]